jgi:pyruvate/2-oxoglutarate dehydrogenase complex dihydrolipoamide acyltransferase (E2) component
MSVNVNFPRVAMGINEGTIATWRKAVGDRVESGEVLVEVETAKVIQEVTAPADGVLSSILVQQGETVPVNTVLGVIDN